MNSKDETYNITEDGKRALREIGLEEPSCPKYECQRCEETIGYCRLTEHEIPMVEHISELHEQNEKLRKRKCDCIRNDDWNNKKYYVERGIVFCGICDNLLLSETTDCLDRFEEDKDAEIQNLRDDIVAVKKVVTLVDHEKAEQYEEIQKLQKMVDDYRQLDYNKEIQKLKDELRKWNEKSNWVDENIMKNIDLVSIDSKEVILKIRDYTATKQQNEKLSAKLKGLENAIKIYQEQEACYEAKLNNITREYNFQIQKLNTTELQEKAPLCWTKLQQFMEIMDKILQERI